MKNVGIIGLGNMGMGMAKNLIRKGFPTKGYDVFAPKLDQFEQAGGVPCHSPAEVGEGSDVVFVMVLNGQQALDVAFGTDGLIHTDEARLYLFSHINDLGLDTRSSLAWVLRKKELR